jgi:hypothetical protein
VNTPSGRARFHGQASVILNRVPYDVPVGSSEPDE